MATIARAKTLNTVRQLDASRSSNVIRLSLRSWTANYHKRDCCIGYFNSETVKIDKNVFKTVTKIGKLSLIGVYLHNCTLNNTRLHDIDFSSAQLDHVDFSIAELYNITISFAKLGDVEFVSANTERC